MVLKRVALGYSTDSDQQYMFLRLCLNELSPRHTPKTCLLSKFEALVVFVSVPRNGIGRLHAQSSGDESHTHTHKQTDKTPTHTDTDKTQTHTQTDTYTNRHTDKTHTHRERHTHTHRHTDRNTHTQTYTHTHTDTQTDTQQTHICTDSQIVSLTQALGQPH